jgi:hypothetical protein
MQDRTQVVSVAVAAAFTENNKIKTKRIRKKRSFDV